MSKDRKHHFLSGAYFASFPYYTGYGGAYSGYGYGTGSGSGDGQQSGGDTGSSDGGDGDGERSN
jgi:hypothetical protein